VHEFSCQSFAWAIQMSDGTDCYFPVSVISGRASLAAFAGSKPALFGLLMVTAPRRGIDAPGD